MTDQTDIPILTDLIEKGIEIKLSDLGLEICSSSGLSFSGSPLSAAGVSISIASLSL